MCSTFHYFLSPPGCFNSKIEERKLTKNARCIIPSCPNLSLLPFITACQWSCRNIFFHSCVSVCSGGSSYVIFTWCFWPQQTGPTGGHVQMCSTVQGPPPAPVPVPVSAPAPPVQLGSRRLASYWEALLF